MLMTETDATYRPYDLQIRRTVKAADVEALLRATSVRPLAAGIAYLINAQTGEPFAPYLEYVVQTAMTRSQTKPGLSKSRLTIEAYASDLCDFFNFLDAVQRCWHEVDEVDAYHYIDTMIEHPSPATGKPFADETIRRRMSSVRRFYKWARSRGVSKTNLELVDPGDCLRARRYLGGPGDAIAPTAPAADREVRPIPPAELQALMLAHGPDIALGPASDIGEMVPHAIRNRLMAECAYHIGLRRAEVVGLQAEQVQNLSLDSSSPYLMHPIRVFGKGAKWRTVNVPTWLLIGLQRYYNGPRAEAVKNNQEHGYIFVAHSAARSGKPLSEKYFDDVFADACLKAGLHHPADPSIAKYTVHHLRHNYALSTYFARKASGDPEPWLYIQAMLGHAFVETTLRIYLRAAKALEGVYSDYFDAALKEMVRNA